MASKFYLRNTTETVGISPTPDSGWEDTASFARCLLRLASSSDALTTVTITETSSTSKDCLARQYIAPLKSGQTVTGAQAVQFVAKFTETTTGNNMNSAFGIRVIASDGSTVRKTVLAVTREAAEFDAGTPGTLESRNNTATSEATNYTTVAGDYLVVEIGAGGDPSSTNPHTYNISLGDNAAAFLDASDVDTGADNPWCQMTDTLTLEYSIEPPAVSLSQIFAPSTALNIEAPASSLTTITPPTAALNILGATVSLSSIFVPDVSFVLEPPAVSLSLTFAPEITAGPTLEIPAVSLSTITSPGLSYVVEAPAVSLSQFFAPALALNVAFPHVNQAQAFAPLAIEPGIVGSSVNLSQMFAPDVVQNIVMAFVNQASINTPALAYRIEPAGLSQSSIFTPAIVVAAKARSNMNCAVHTGIGI
jgi:hypothetical protein